MLRFASLMRSAIRRRTPITLISEVSPVWVASPAAGGARSAGAPHARAPLAASRSSRTMRPPGPDPATVARSIPASRARLRLAGEVMIRPPAGAARGAASALVAAPPCVGPLAALGLAAAAGIAAGCVAAGGAAASGAAVGGAAGAPAPTSKTINGEPTAILSPGSPRMETTRPLTGAGTSTAALSVITSTMI